MLYAYVDQLSTTSRLSPTFQRHPAVALRRERWGGFAFHRGHGDLLELDEQGFEVLAGLGREIGLHELRFAVGCADCRPRLPNLAQFVGELKQRGFVQQISAVDFRPNYRSPGRVDTVHSIEQRFMRDSRELSAPLVAHWAVTYRCNLACSFCYSESSPVREREPAEDIRIRIVERLAEWGVFEVALGGGEPTILPDFPRLLAAIRRCGMVPNVTTNGMLNSAKTLHALAEHVGVVHLSADRSDLLGRCPRRRRVGPHHGNSTVSFRSQRPLGCEFVADSPQRTIPRSIPCRAAKYRGDRHHVAASERNVGGPELARLSHAARLEAQLPRR